VHATLSSHEQATRLPRGRARMCVLVLACVRAHVTGNVANDGRRVSDRPIELHAARTEACLPITRTQHAQEGLRDTNGFVGVVCVKFGTGGKVAA
jgi:hypothetical protein